MNRISVLGSGGMGTALAVLFAGQGATVRLWSRSRGSAEEIEKIRENRRHLAGVGLPDAIHSGHDVEEATEGADLIVAAVPSAYLRATLREIAPKIPANVPVLSVIKGIENETFARPSEILLASLGPRPIAVLSGPSHAEEIARGLPASVVVAGSENELCVGIRDALNGGLFRVYTNGDALGVELAGALKNVLGVAAGICDGLGFGDNAKAALLTRGLVEIRRFAVDLGADPLTFSGLAGVGDVITTCYSPFGRNRGIGIEIGRGASLAEALARTLNVAEGVTTAKSVHEQARRRGVPMPITDEVHAVLYEGKRPIDAVTDLMLRNPKDEGA